MEKQTNEKAQKGFFGKISKRLTSLTMQKAVVAVAIIFILAFIVTAGNVIIKNGQITAADNLVVDTDTLFVNATNNRVGIGTTNPSYTLQVDGEAQIDSKIWLGDIANMPTSRYLYLLTDSYGGKVTTYFDNTNLTLQAGSTAGYYSKIILSAKSSNNQILFSTDGDNNMVIKGGTGNVGIGTTSPSQKLHVQGNLNVTGDIWGEGKLITTSPVILESADGGKTIIGMKADDSKWVGCAVYNVNGNYEFRCAPNEEVDAKLAKIEERRVCDSQSKLFNAETHECYDAPVESLE